MSGQAAAESLPAIPPELLLLIEQGFAVFPLRPGAKEPAVRDWRRRASTDPEIIAHWVREFPNSNWAVALPPDVIVLDFDGARGAEALRSLQERFGPFRTLMVRSGGDHGGVHVYFRAPGHHLHNQANILPGVDLKVMGGYVVVPPSRVRAPYEFIQAAGGEA